jgi:glycerophosphodiester phosphodiesterase
MKFGRNLHRFQVPEWAPYYIDYNGSKKLFKSASKSAVERAVDADFTGLSNSAISSWPGSNGELELFAALSRDIGSVETFYEGKYAVIQQKATALYNYYGIHPDSFDTVNLDEVDQHELEDLLGAFIELLDGMEKLQWYGKVNRDGFRKILRKLDKFRSRSDQYPYEGDPTLSNSQFASQTKCLKDLERITKSVADLSRANPQNRPSSKRVSLFLENFCNRSYPSFASPDVVYHAIREDDPSALGKMLQEQASGDGRLSTSFQALLLALLRCSVSCGSRLCIDELLPRVGTLQNDNFASGDNYLHRLVIKIGRKKTLKGRQGQESHPQRSTCPTKSSEEYLPLLTYTLDRLGHGQQSALQQKDSFGRLPLHYAAQYGLVEACQEILKHMQDWGQLQNSNAINDTLLQDSEGCSPLHLGVIGGHTMVTRTLLEFHEMKGAVEKTANTQNLDTILWTLLVIALQSGFTEIVQLLVATNIGINGRSKYEESGLYIAARSGREDCVKILIEALSSRKIDMDVLETIYGWTPLFIACVEGHLPIVELLLRGGANQEICDHSGWRAIEHAAFRGHMQVAERLRASTAGEPTSGAVVPGQLSIRANQQSTKNVTSTSNPSASLGRYSPDKSQIFVNLGSLDSNKDVIAVDLSPYLSLDACTSRPEIGFSIEISAIGASGLNHAIQLPILEDMTNEPWVFSASDPNEVKVVFNILRTATDTGGDGVLIGSGIALLESLKQGLGPKRESLIRDYTIPILGKDTLKFVGTVTFSFVIVRPFPHPGVTPTATHEPWGKAGSTRVVGHRGYFPSYS